MSLRKVRKVRTVWVPTPDVPERLQFIINDVKGDFSLLVHQAVDECQIKPGETLTVDVRLVCDDEAGYDNR